MWTFDEEEPPKEEQLPAALEGISKSWIMPAKEDAPSTKQSTPGIFLTQLDESQYPELPRTVPVFVLPFVDQEWFQNLFPEGIPPEMTSKVLLRKLQETLLTADYSTKTEVLGAIVYLEDQLEDRAKRWIQYTLFEVLNQEGNTPSLQEKSQKKFILAALRVLLHLDKDSLDLMVELMTCYLMAAPSARAVFKDMFKELGLQDPHNFFFKEMNSWMVGMEDSKEVVRKLSKEWLEEKIRIFKEHRAHLLEEAASGKLFLDTGHKTTTLLTLERKRPEKSRKKARKITGKGTKAVHKASPIGCRKGMKNGKDGLLLSCLPTQDEMDSEEERRGKPSLEDHQKSVRPIDAIQHFAEKQLERERRELKEAVLLRAESPRDTVLALPPLQKSRAILRLGETNAMLRTRVAERCCFPIVFPRYLMKGFVPFLKLPLPRITLQPFPSLPRRPASPRTFAAMQQLVHKYFIPKFSYADSYP